MGRSICALRHYCLKLDIQAIPNWTVDETDWLKQNYKIKSLTECATHLGRTESAIKNKLNELGLKKKRL